MRVLPARQKRLPRACSLASQIASDPLQPLLSEGSDLRDISAHPQFESDGRPGTFGNGNKGDKIDYILLSPALFERVTSGDVWRKQKRRGYYYYHCPKRRQYGKEFCSHAKHHPAEKMESAVWSAVSSILKDPEQLRDDLDRMIELERRGMRQRNPDKEARLWAEKLAEAERMRRGYQEQAAKGYMSLDELGAALEMLEEARKTAERELRNLKSQQEFIEELERDKEALLDYYAALAPEALDALTAEERHQLYKMLKLRASASQDGSVKVSGVFGDSFCICESELAPPCRFQSQKFPVLRFSAF